MIFLDHNATTPLRPEVAELLTRCLQSQAARPGNASSVHRGGRAARARLDAARDSVAALLECEPRDVCWTSSGSEGAALAIKGAFAARRDKSRRRVVTSSIEHPAVLGAVAQLERAGAEVVRVAPESDGRVSPEKLMRELVPQTFLCSLMWANNETGVLQPVVEVARACRDRGVVFHTDAVQAIGKVPVSLRAVGADLLSLSAHKFGGPTGAGALLVRRGIDLEPIVPGHQESGRRGGTSDVAGAEALALALALALQDLVSEGPAIAARRDAFERLVSEKIPDVVSNGGAAPRVPNTSNLRFLGADGEAVLIGLDLAGVCVSSGAACASGSLKPSHVLTEMGLSSAEAHASLRFSLGASTSQAELDEVVAALVSLVASARR